MTVMKGHKSKRIGLTMKLLFILQGFSDMAATENLYVPYEQDFSIFRRLVLYCFQSKKDHHVTKNHCKWVSKKQVYIVFLRYPAHADYYLSFVHWL